jgi:hypothetical protein
VRCQEALREATKLFKAEGLTAPGKEDRQTVEKQYSSIKENLSKYVFGVDMMGF